MSTQDQNPNPQDPTGSGAYQPEPSGEAAPADPYAQPPAAPYGQQPGTTPPPPPGSTPPPPPGYGAPQYAAPPAYGAPQYAAAPMTTPYPKNWMNTTGMVLSLLGLITGITAIAGVIFGHLGLAAVKRGEADNRGQGVAALVIGYILIVLGIVATIAIIAFAGWFVNECGGDNPASWCTDLDSQ
ncbi:DUF4190 domain-containing protein [Demequina lignilytica]|uniref:DUF4190 domain-containing protein n=1 Tax=Demequina lignilytica TaxID=3051663 RepID=A0AAW7M046_9MICO|nr:MULTISPECIES: DUF4190 domain-containing protein [unclassified Demequina]MDN4477370.1 DUF4190 domain-containing protein [Demequina sp. SYSU T00039-1]MDN4483139.1 DUF4190 domain-containing protein [Demequina sp. SYSU T0a273]MDN4487543.1 DUF4190 domain-containing protein [Demequina sp. SYSU T00039]